MLIPLKRRRKSILRKINRVDKDKKFKSTKLLDKIKSYEIKIGKNSHYMKCL